MDLIESKKNCNLKYVKLLELLRQKGDMNLIHSKIVEVANALVDISNLFDAEKDKCVTKAISLIKVAKGITASSKHEDVYFRITGDKLDHGHTNELEKIRKELDALHADNSDLVSKNEHCGIVDLPKHPRYNGTDSIRPMYLDDYVGQTKVKALLGEAIAAAKLKERTLEHILFFGSAGLGKTSLSKIVANEMNSNIIIMSGPTIKDPMTLVSFIKDVKYGDIVFIDEIHRINPLAAEAIYTVMEDFELSYLEKNKNSAKNITLQLPKFTIIGATTHSGLLEKPMRDRFSLQFKLELYNVQDLSAIALSTMKKLGQNMDEAAALEIAQRSRGIPRNCNSFVKRIHDRALLRKTDTVDANFVIDYFNLNGIDSNGLLDIDIQYLKTIYEKFGNKAVGIDNLASCLGEGKNIIEIQIEPYLIYLGLIQIAPNGRLLTSSGIDYIRNS